MRRESASDMTIIEATLRKYYVQIIKPCSVILKRLTSATVHCKRHLLKLGTNICR